MTFASEYNEAVYEVTRLKRERLERSRELEAEVRATAWVTKNGETVTNLNAGMDHVVRGRIATDPIMKDLQVLIDRSIAEATMYGVGALMNLLARRVET